MNKSTRKNCPQMTKLSLTTPNEFYISRIQTKEYINFVGNNNIDQLQIISNNDYSYRQNVQYRHKYTNKQAIVKKLAKD